MVCSILWVARICSLPSENDARAPRFPRASALGLFFEYHLTWFAEVVFSSCLFFRLRLSLSAHSYYSVLREFFNSDRRKKTGTLGTPNSPPLRIYFFDLFVQVSLFYRFSRLIFSSQFSSCRKSVLVRHIFPACPLFFQHTSVRLHRFVV